MFRRYFMSFLTTDGAFSDELSTLVVSHPQDWWKLSQSEGVGVQEQPLLDPASNQTGIPFADSAVRHWSENQASSLILDSRLEALPESDRGLVVDDISDVDPITGGSLSAALVTNPPAYPGYLLSYEPGGKLESRSAVAQWQAQMQRRGWQIDVDGLYGPQSERVAIAFQREKGLVADGIVGPQTWQVAFDESTITAPQPEQNFGGGAPASGRINEAGLALIKDFEGLRLNAYQDAVGVWTIGYGHTSTAYPGQSITTAQATALLRQDVANFEDAVTRAVQVPITENQFAALVSFAYNVGSGALNSSTLLRKLNAGDTFGAADEFLRWNRAGGQVLAGLTRRREAERALFLS